MKQTQSRIFDDTSIEMRFARAEPQAHIVEIPPDLATEMLKTSPGNRKMRGWYVELLAGAMKRGEWRITCQGIGFDVGGRLREGHHRLNACVLSGIPLKTMVVLGMPLNSYEVIDTGIVRTYADRMGEDRAITEVLRLGTHIALGFAKPTVDQIRPLADAGLRDAASTLIEYCGSVRKYYSTAPMRLAACTLIMNGANSEFILKQYRALCCLDFDSMTNSAKSLVRQVNSGRTRANDTREVLARGLRVFDENKKDLSKIQVTDVDMSSASSLVRTTLLGSLATAKR